jgi:hypothetical protein
MFPYLSVDLVWLLRKSKEGNGFQGRHKDLALGQPITKTVVINLGSKEKEDEETTRSFNNSVFFEVNDWNEIEDYALSEINLEHELSRDRSKPAAIPNNEPSTKPSAISHEKPSAIPATIPRKKSSATPQEDAKNDDDITEDKRKPAAILQEEMKTPLATPQPIQYSIPFIPPIAGTNMKVGTWICEFCDSQWPQSQKRCGTCKKWKGGKRSLSKNGQSGTNCVKGQGEEKG